MKRPLFNWTSHARRFLVPVPNCKSIFILRFADAAEWRWPRLLGPGKRYRTTECYAGR